MTPREQLAALSDGSRMSFTARDVDNIVGLKELNQLWLVTVFLMANSKLTVHIKTPSEQESTFLCNCHGMLPAARYHPNLNSIKISCHQIKTLIVIFD